MDLIRIGDKLISIPRIEAIVKDMLALRQQGVSQQEVAKKYNTDRTFLSRLESLGEIRKGKTIALIGFPIKNIEEIKRISLEEGVDFTLLMTDKERWDFVYEKSGIELLNTIMTLLHKVRQYDVVIMLGSDKRLRLFQALLDKEVVPINIGKSPINQDICVDSDNLRKIIKTIKKDD
ncbi:MAG: transcriptional regulator [Tepidanaerobacteraceae bacterium]|nr:transcriptional regulator [Thermoanaerobacterales bacterium]